MVQLLFSNGHTARHLLLLLCPALGTRLLILLLPALLADWLCLAMVWVLSGKRNVVGHFERCLGVSQVSTLVICGLPDQHVEVVCPRSTTRLILSYKGVSGQGSKDSGAHGVSQRVLLAGDVMG